MVYICAKPALQEVGQLGKVPRAGFALDSTAAVRACAWLWTATRDTGGQATGSYTESPGCIQQALGARGAGRGRQALSAPLEPLI